MKLFLGAALAATTLAGSVSLGCSPAEAQFIGKVKSINKVIASDGSMNCTIQVGEFRFYQDSLVCGLDQSIAQSLILPARSCSLQVGDEVSGILSLDQDGNVTW